MKKQKRKLIGLLLSQGAVVLFLLLILGMKFSKPLLCWIEMAFGVDIDISLPKSTEKWIMIVSFSAAALGSVILFIMAAVRRHRLFRKMEQLEEEQSRRVIYQDSVSGFLRKHGAANSRKIYTKPKISAEEQAEADRLDDLNRESSTEWW